MLNPQILLLICMSFVYNAQLLPNVNEIARAKLDILNVINANKIIGRDGLEFPFIAGFVRLAFHDCVGPGHCDGCINHALAGNAGLKRYTDALDKSFTGNGHVLVMSRADFYALSSLVALERATDFVSDKFTALKDGLFRVGRKDCSASPSEDDNAELPDAKFNIGDTLSYFRREFGFSPQEVVALMGAHTLGRASVSNSGYEGKWIRGQINGSAQSDTLNNQFYFQVRGDWVQVRIAGSGKFQWQKPGTAPNTGFEGRAQPGMFVNSDMSLLWDLNPVGREGNVSCTVNCAEALCCRRSLTNAITRGYAISNTSWLKDFTSVFMKMINMNEATLTQPDLTVAGDMPNWIDDAIHNLDDVNALIENVVNDLKKHPERDLGDLPA